jgi:hypothetical protein
MIEEGGQGSMYVDFEPYEAPRQARWRNRRSEISARNKNTRVIPKYTQILHEKLNQGKK